MLTVVDAYAFLSLKCPKSLPHYMVCALLGSGLWVKDINREGKEWTSRHMFKPRHSRDKRGLRFAS
jgi:hypothetical protein